MKADEMFNHLKNMGFEPVMELVNVKGNDVKVNRENHFKLEINSHIIIVSTAKFPYVCVYMDGEELYRNLTMYSYTYDEPLNFTKKLIRQIKIENILDNQ